MLIWGYRQQVQQLTMATFLCGSCGNPTAHALRRAVTKFTLFFIPLFPINSKYFTQCTFCGATNRVPKADAQQILASQQNPAAAQGTQPPAGQAPHPAQPNSPQAQPFPQQPQSQPFPQQQYPQQQPPQQPRPGA